MSKRSRPWDDDSSSDDSDSSSSSQHPPPPPRKRVPNFEERLRALAALGVREGDVYVDVDELRPRLNPDDGTFVDPDDPNRRVPAGEGYVRDWVTGRVTPEQEGQGPFNPAYWAEVDRRMELFRSAPSVQFFEHLAALTNKNPAEFINRAQQKDWASYQHERQLAADEARKRMSRTAEDKLREREGYQKAMRGLIDAQAMIRANILDPIERYRSLPTAFADWSGQYVDGGEFLRRLAPERMFIFPFYMRWQYSRVLPDLLSSGKPLDLEALEWTLRMDEILLDHTVRAMGPLLRGHDRSGVAESERRVRARFIRYIVLRDLRRVPRGEARFSDIPSHGHHLRRILLHHLQRSVASLPGFQVLWEHAVIPREAAPSGLALFVSPGDARAINSINALCMFTPEYNDVDYILGTADLAMRGEYVRNAVPGQRINAIDRSLQVALDDLNADDTIADPRRFLNRLDSIAGHLRNTLLWVAPQWQWAPNNVEPPQQRPAPPAIATGMLDQRLVGGQQDQLSLFGARSLVPWLQDYDMACVTLERLMSPLLLQFVEEWMPFRENEPNAVAFFQLPRRLRPGLREQRAVRYRADPQQWHGSPLELGDYQDYYHYTQGYFGDPQLLYEVRPVGGNQGPAPNRAIGRLKAWSALVDDWHQRYNRYAGPWLDFRKSAEWNQHRVTSPAAPDVRENTISAQALFSATMKALTGDFGQKMAQFLAARQPADYEGATAVTIREALLPFAPVPVDPVLLNEGGDGAVREELRLEVASDMQRRPVPGAGQWRTIAFINSLSPLAAIDHHLWFLQSVYSDDSERAREIERFRQSIANIDRQIHEMQREPEAFASPSRIQRALQETHVLSGVEMSSGFITGRMYLTPLAVSLVRDGMTKVRQLGWTNVRAEQLTDDAFAPNARPALMAAGTAFAAYIAYRWMDIQFMFPDTYKTQKQYEMREMRHINAVTQLRAALTDAFGPPPKGGCPPGGRVAAGRGGGGGLSLSIFG